MRIARYVHQILVPTMFVLGCVNGAITSAIAAPGQPGSLDVTFGTGGKKVTAFGVGNDYADAMALQPDGKLLVGGGCSNGTDTDLCVVRYLADGTLDPSFGDNGKFSRGTVGVSDVVYSIALQPDGKIVLAGSCSNGSDRDFCIARLLSNGALDPSFAADGDTLVNMTTGDDFARSVVIQPDGKIVAGGWCHNATRNREEFCAVRLLANGDEDMSFNGGGRVITAVNGNDYGSAIALQPDGKIVMGGACWNDTRTLYEFCALRYTADGALDLSFNGTGLVTTAVGSFGHSDAFAMALQTDGKIVLAGDSEYATDLYRFGALRYNNDGSLDTAFGDAGSIIHAWNGADGVGYGVVVSADGRINIGGNCGGDLCAMRLRPNGALDSTFGISGVAVVPIGIADNGTGIVQQADGKLVMTGYCDMDATATDNFDFCTVRFDAALGGQSCALLDLDGDGSKATINDALLHARIAIGITGDPLVSNLSFASSATRQTWPAIRDYLIAQCGAANCGFDFDADGQPLATVDSLLMMRLARGVSSSAASGGMNFSAAATRDSWALIRNDLVSRCGLSLP